MTTSGNRAAHGRHDEEAGVYSASADSSSRNPQDWGRAAAQLFQQLAEQASTAGGGPVEENMVNADIHMHVKSIPGGVTISATWETLPAID
jgi:hypothetical protein